MKRSSNAFYPRGIALILCCTFGGTVACTVVSMLITYFFIAPFGPDVMRVSLGLAFWIPILLAIPLFSYIGIKLQQLSHANHLLKHANRIDGLTRCLNRATFTSEVFSVLEQRAADGSTQASGMLIIDADHFKQINDRFGHLVGDQTLVAIADGIGAALYFGEIEDRIEGWFVGRLGGEEFGVFLPSASPGSLCNVAERIRRLVAQDVKIATQPDATVTVSIGGVCFAHPAQYEDVFRLADEQLYLAKNNGRNRVCVPDARDGADHMVQKLKLAGRDMQRERAAV